MREEEIITWETLEYEPRRKSADWYWAVGIIATAGAAVAFIVGNTLFAIVIVIAALSLMLVSARGPARLHIMLSREGVVINERLYPFTTLRSFWVEFEADPPKLLITSKRPLVPHITIPIHEVAPDDVRIFLTHHLKEEEQDEGVASSVLERMGL